MKFLLRWCLSSLLASTLIFQQSVAKKRHKHKHRHKHPAHHQDWHESNEFQDEWMVPPLLRSEPTLDAVMESKLPSNQKVQGEFEKPLDIIDDLQKNSKLKHREKFNIKEFKAERERKPKGNVINIDLDQSKKQGHNRRMLLAKANAEIDMPSLDVPYKGHVPEMIKQKRAFAEAVHDLIRDENEWSNDEDSAPQDPQSDAVKTGENEKSGGNATNKAYAGKELETCTCGLAKPTKSNKNPDSIDNKIVNGYDPGHSRPFLALLLVGQHQALCGGSLINHRFVLTAAHCFCYDNGREGFMCEKEDVTDSKALESIVRVQVGPRHRDNDPGESYKGIALHHHPERIKLEREHRKQNFEYGYSPFAGPYDVSLVKLDRNVKFIPDKISPICLFNVDYSNFKYGYVAGFGSSSYKTMNGVKCWTTKEGPNPFSECREVNCIEEQPIPNPKHCPEAFKSFKKEKQKVDRLYIKDNGKKEMCVNPKLTGKHGWCHVLEPSTEGADWGVCSNHCEGAGASKKLVEARLHLLPDKECHTHGQSSNARTKIEICAALQHKDNMTYAVVEYQDKSFKVVDEGVETLHYYGGSDACQGDSGGALWVWAQKSKSAPVQAFQIGIVSRGDGCAFRNKPGIFTRIDQFKDFITSKMAEGGCSKYKLP